MNVRRLLLNTGSASVPVILSAIVLFVVYGYIVREIGIDLFGVWATVAASTSVAAIGGLGLAGGVVKFVAKYRALDDLRRVSIVLSTSMVAAAIALGIMAALGLLLLPSVLPWLMDRPDELEVGIELVPYVVVSFWLTSVSAIGVSGLRIGTIKQAFGENLKVSGPGTTGEPGPIQPVLSLSGSALARSVGMFWCQIRF